MRLIDADAIDWGCIEHKYGARDDAVVDCEIMIDIAPTIDAVPVVRCKDCKWSIKDDWICGHPNNNAWNISTEHYCGYGERKDDEIV